MFDCKGCKDSCCSRKTIGLNRGDLLRINEVINDNILKYIIFREDIQGRTVKGNKYKGVLALREINGSCIFLKNELCSIYTNRPLSCRMYPYNPIFTEGKNGYDLKIEVDNTCKEIKKGKCFKVKQTALQWRNERLEYDKLVFKWNKKKDRNLIKFVKGLLK